MSKILLPYEPNYVGGREAEKRREQTKEWLLERERTLAKVSPPFAPEDTPKDKNAK